MIRRTPLTRRRLVTMAASTAVIAVAGPAVAALSPTPRQTTGPFYPLTKPVDSDADLVTVAGRPGPAKGTVTHVIGRVLDPGGRPVADARVEIWQCDALGAYRFRTIRPVPYPGRTPHIHFAVTARGFPFLTTQMYVAGEPRNDGDFVLRRITDPQARASIIVALEPAPDVEAGALLGVFDIVLGNA